MNASAALAHCNGGATGAPIRRYRRACSPLWSGRLTDSAARTDVALFIHRAVRPRHTVSSMRASFAAVLGGYPLLFFIAMGPTPGDCRVPVALSLQRVERDEPS